MRFPGYGLHCSQAKLSPTCFPPPLATLAPSSKALPPHEGSLARLRPFSLLPSQAWWQFSSSWLTTTLPRVAVPTTTQRAPHMSPGSSLLQFHPSAFVAPGPQMSLPLTSFFKSQQMAPHLEAFLDWPFLLESTSPSLKLPQLLTCPSPPARSKCHLTVFMSTFSSTKWASAPSLHPLRSFIPHIVIERLLHARLCTRTGETMTRRQRLQEAPLEGWTRLEGG